MTEGKNIAEHPQLDSRSLAGTFAKRGLVVPFTTSLLCFSRLRITSEDDAEILVPGLTDGASYIVVPLSSLGEAVSFSVFDRSFIEKLKVNPNITPYDIRMAAYQVAELGIAGPKLAKLARAASDARKNLLPLITINLTHSAIDQLAGNDPLAQDLDEGKLATPEGMLVAKKALRGYAESVGLTPGQIFSCFENWGEIIAEIGTPGTHKGYLTLLIDEMERFQAELDSWRGAEPIKTSEICQQIGIVINQTLMHAREYQRETYSYVNHMGETLKSWQEISKRLKHATNRLDLVLDGWAQIIQIWDSAFDYDRDEKRQILMKIAPSIPVLPIEEVQNDKDFWQDLRNHQRRWLAISNGEMRTKSPISERHEQKETIVAPGDAA